MVHTTKAARGRTKRDTRKREKPLGAAIALGLMTTLGVAALISVIQFLVPHSALHNFYQLVHYNSSATLPLDPLYQDLMTRIQTEDALFLTPVSLFCGGLVLGWLAPRYASYLRVYVSGGLTGLGITAASVGFTWPTAIFQQKALNAHDGGEQVALSAPPSLIAEQAFLMLAWIAVCILGTWLGQHLRDWRFRPFSFHSHQPDGAGL